MKINRFIPIVLALTALFTNTAYAAAPAFLLDFENKWDYGADVAEYYNGGTAYNVGSPLTGVSGTNYGVSFSSTNDSAMLGVSNDGLGSIQPNGDYYTNAPSALGTATPFGTVYMNVAAGVDSLLSFYYSSPNAVIGAVKAYSGLNGTGTLLGSFDLSANNSGLYDTWSSAIFTFSGTALSFDFSASSNIVGFDNISNVAAIPEPETYALMLAGLGVMGFVARRNK